VLICRSGAEALVNNLVFVAFVFLAIVLVRGAGFSTTLLVVSAGIAIALCVGAVVLSYVMPVEMPTVKRLPQRLVQPLSHHWPHFRDGFEVFRRPKLLGTLLLLNLFGWGVDIAINYSYGHAFNLHLPVAAFISVTVAVAVVTTIPITFGNLGTWELAVVGVLALYDVPVDRALAYAAGSHVAIGLFNIALGIAATGLMRIALSDVFSLGRRAPAMASATSN
jgi:uncharacterized membrane protein YbhN (UPF0104 family)